MTIQCSFGRIFNQTKEFSVAHTRQYYAALFPDRACGHLVPSKCFFFDRPAFYVLNISFKSKKGRYVWICVLYDIYLLFSPFFTHWQNIQFSIPNIYLPIPLKLWEKTAWKLS